jgi:hypothetical protein
VRRARVRALIEWAVAHNPYFAELLMRPQCELCIDLGSVCWLWLVGIGIGC